jgi:DNA-binding transcriptional ArsR family regulator
MIFWFYTSLVLNLRTIELLVKSSYNSIMRPLFHPSIDDVTVETILHALSDPVRAAIYVDIAGSDCSQNCSNFLRISERDVPKSTLSQHFKALREAGLIRGERRGVEMHNTSRSAELERRFPGLIPAIIRAHKVQGAGKARAGTSRSKKSPAARLRKR